MQGRIEPPQILLTKNEIDNVSECEIIKINIYQNLSDANLEMYELNIEMFEHKQPEEFLTLMKNFRNEIDGLETNLATGKVNYLLTL